VQASVSTAQQPRDLWNDDEFEAVELDDENVKLDAHDVKLDAHVASLLELCKRSARAIHSSSSSSSESAKSALDSDMQQLLLDQLRLFPPPSSSSSSSFSTLHASSSSASTQVAPFWLHRHSLLTHEIPSLPILLRIQPDVYLLRQLLRSYADLIFSSFGCVLHAVHR
jgi:hypothetical protein